ncbi:MAG: 50S ribosomal protein L1 [Candidatus Aenigmatarchaeota archaeon]
MDKYTIIDAIKYLKENSKKRNFIQSFDLIVTLKNIDTKKPENKFSKDLILPHGRGKDIKICIISENGDIKRSDIEELGTNKKKAKELAKKYDFFVCEAPLMPLVGKILGKYLAPKNKMPKLLPPGKDLKSVIDEIKNTVRIRLRDSPTIQVSVGTEKMEDNQIRDNIEKVLEEIKKSLPQKAQIKNIYIKLTMSKPVRIGV